MSRGAIHWLEYSRFAPLLAKQVQQFASNQKESQNIKQLIMEIESICLQACEELNEEIKTIKKSKNEHQYK